MIENESMNANMGNPNGMFTPTPCVCCGAEEQDVRYPIDTHHASRLAGMEIAGLGVGVAVCGRCGHESIQPVPSPAFLEAYYSAYMSSAKSGFYQERAAETIPERFRGRYTPWLDRIHAMVGGRQRRLLDIGAGLGMFLRLARECGFDVQGVEPNKEAADALFERFGIPVVNGLFEDVELAEKVDVVTMWDLLEHLADPRSALEKAASLVVSGGLLVMEIPARDSLLHNLAKASYRLSGGRIRRPLLLVCGVHHLHYFSQRDISHLMNECGFEVKEIHRGETELASLYRGHDQRRSVASKAYNVALTSVFWMARLLRRQNKLIIFARKS